MIDIWQWSELTSFGDLPSPRDFAAASAIGNRRIVMLVSVNYSTEMIIVLFLASGLEKAQKLCRYGGWDGKKWLSDVYVLDTSNISIEEL